MRAHRTKIIALAFLLVAVAIIAYVGYSMNGIREAQATLKQLGHPLSLRQVRQLRELNLSGVRITPQALRALSHLPRLETLNLSRTGVTDEGLSAIADLDKLHALNLNGTRVTDKGIRKLKSLKNLEVLELKHTELTDAGLQHLRSLPALRELQISHTRVTDKGLEHLLAHKNRLETLNLIETLVTDKGMGALLNLTRLKTLYLKDTQVTDKGLEQVASLSGLQRLGLGNTKITNAGLRSLQRLASLQTLYLDQTRVSDAGLAALARIKSLTLLNLAATKVTPAGVDRLRRALPRLGVVMRMPPQTLVSAAAPAQAKPKMETQPVAKGAPETPPPQTYVPRFQVSFSDSDYPAAARKADLGWVIVGVHLTISPTGKVERTDIRYVRSSRNDVKPFVGMFGQSAKRLFARAGVANPPPKTTTVDTKVTFKLH